MIIGHKYYWWVLCWLIIPWCLLHLYKTYKVIGWIIYRVAEAQLTSKDYEINQLIAAARQFHLQINVYRPEQFEIMVHKAGRKSILIDGENVNIPDFVIARLGADTSFFALSILRHLERLGVYLLNSSDAIEIVRNKLYSIQILAEHNFPIPNTLLAKFPVNMGIVEKHFTFPLIVKSLSGSKGSGVFLCQNALVFSDLMNLIEEANSKANIIVQEFIEASYGKDLRVLVLGDRVLCAMKRIAVEGSFKANYSLGGKVEYIAIDSETEQLCVSIVKCLGLDFAGVDLLFDADGYKICEVNSSPGFKGMESVNEMNISQLIIEYLLVKLGVSLAH